jgi:hypothetical protein
MLFALCCSWRHAPMILIFESNSVGFVACKASQCHAAPRMVVLFFNRLQRKICTPLSSTDRPPFSLLLRPKASRRSPFAFHIIQSSSVTEARKLFCFYSRSLFGVRSVRDCLKRAYRWGARPERGRCAGHTRGRAEGVMWIWFVGVSLRSEDWRAAGGSE